MPQPPTPPQITNDSVSFLNASKLTTLGGWLLSTIPGQQLNTTYQMIYLNHNIQDLGIYPLMLHVRLSADHHRFQLYATARNTNPSGVVSGGKQSLSW